MTAYHARPSTLRLQPSDPCADRLRMLYIGAPGQIATLKNLAADAGLDATANAALASVNGPYGRRLLKGAGDYLLMPSCNWTLGDFTWFYRGAPTYSQYRHYVNLGSGLTVQGWNGHTEMRIWFNGVRHDLTGLPDLRAGRGMVLVRSLAEGTLKFYLDGKLWLNQPVSGVPVITSPGGVLNKSDQTLSVEGPFDVWGYSQTPWGIVQIQRFIGDPFCMLRPRASRAYLWAPPVASPPPTGQTGVTLTQSTEAAFTDRTAGAGLKVTMNPSGDGQYLQRDLNETRTRIHTRCMIRSQAAGGNVTFLRGLDAAASETFRVVLDAVSGQIRLVLATGQSLSGDPPAGLSWHAVEAGFDIDTGSAALWINGRLVDTITGDLTGMATRAMWIGAPFKGASTIGELHLDEWIIADQYIGPVRLDASSDFADDPARWLVVYNTASAESVEWAETYRASRGVPYANLLGLPLSLSETITEAQFTDLRDAITDYLTLNGLDGQVLGILCGHAVPGMYTRADGNAEAIAGQLHLTDGLTDAVSNSLAVSGEEAIIRPTAANLSSRRITARIDGPTLDDSLALTARSLAMNLGDGEDAMIWLDPYGPSGPFYDLRKQEMLDWAAGLDSQRTRLPLRVSATGEPGDDVQFASMDRDAFFWGWEQSSAPAGFFGEPAGPRAFCHQLAFNFATAPTLRNPGDTSWAGAALAAGYAAAAGSTRSFTPSAIPLIRPFFEALRRGWTLGEAWFVACPLLRTGLMLVGDPLMTVAMPRAGWDVFGPFESWDQANFEQPIAMLRQSQRQITLNDDQKPADGQRGIYLVRHVDATGRREAGITHVTSERFGMLPAWPSAPGWSPVAQVDAWRIEARWANSFGAAGVVSVELIEQIQGEAAQPVETLSVSQRDAAVVFTRVVGASAARYRLQVTSIDGAVSAGPWSAWVTLPAVTTQTIQSLGAES